MKPAGILEAAIYARDIAAADRFYGGLLGLERCSLTANHSVMFRLESQMLLVFIPDRTRLQTLDAEPKLWGLPA